MQHFQKPNQTSIGSKIPFSEWNSSVAGMYWLVRWSTKGLAPVRPLIHLKAEAVLPSGRALAL